MERDKGEARTEVNKVLDQQAQKGIKRNEICRSLFSFGFSEQQVAAVMEINSKSAHAAKLTIKDSKRAKKEIKNFLVLDVIRLQGFLKNMKVLVGQPSHKNKDEHELAAMITKTDHFATCPHPQNPL